MAEAFLYNHLNDLKNIGVSLIILIFFLLLRKIFAKYIFKLLLKLSDKTKTDLDQKLFISFEKPFHTLIIVLGIYFALKNVSYLFNVVNLIDFNLFLSKGLRSFIVIFFAWGFYGLEETSSILFSRIEKSLQIDLDKLLVPFISKMLRFLTVMLAICIIAEEWGYDVNGFIAGLGLGGLAFALAAKDTLANIFAGVVIIMDKPFSIGDWIKTSDVEGVVEDINFRSTKIRTFAQGLVTLPNSNLVNGAITNWSKMGKRRITFNLGLMYSTTREQIIQCIEEIKTMLHNHDEIDKETIFVSFDNFNESSLDIFLYFFTNTTNWGEFLKVKQDVNLKIMYILEQNNVSIAFPSKSIYFENLKDIKTL